MSSFIVRYLERAYIGHAMLKFLKKRNIVRPVALKRCERVYAVGDLHGRFDLFEKILKEIGDDVTQNPVKTFKILFLGDLIDRGPDSAGIITRALQLSKSSKKLMFLKGNHEELFLSAMNGDQRAAEFFYQIGGRATLMSYGLDPALGDEMDGATLIRWMHDRIPKEHFDFVSSFEDMVTFANHVFVHAGLKPFVPLKKQRLSDLRWIRREFTGFGGEFPGVVIHGHSISSEVDETQFRIGIDTGAYRTGRLTAVAVDANERRYLSVQGEPGDYSMSPIELAVDKSYSDYPRHAAE